MREPFFAANWKMFKTPTQTREYAQAFAPLAEEFRERAAIVLCAPLIDLVPLHEELLEAGTFVDLGAQTCFWEREGPFTGEVSALMLAGEGVDYCIVGHSERRRLFGETDEVVARKVSALLEADVVPILCVGETLEEHRAGKARDCVRAQLRAGCGHLTDEQRADIVVAYEPIWAIGTGLADTPESADATIGHIREAVSGHADATILYGGSMNADNAEAFCGQPNIDGGLIGSASLDPTRFATLVRNGMRGIDARTA